jgi:nascent polypeptide-associated complex subunit alpha
MSSDHPEITEERKEDNKQDTNIDDEDLKLGKGEKKVRKALMKLGLNKIEGVNRVTIRQKDNYFFVVKDPEVYVSKESDSSYVIFGEISMDDPDKAPLGKSELSNLKAEGAQVEDKKDNVQVVEDDDAEVSEEGIEKESIEMVISETKCSRQKAVKALRKNNGDVVNTILELNN